MRHGKRNVRFGRHGAHRKATVISLVIALVKYKRIETTLTKAKEARRLADRLITWGKKDTLQARRMVFSLLRDKKLVTIVFKDLAPLFAKRNGGYTRVMHTRMRQGDGAQLAILEWTEKKETEAAAKEKVKSKKEKIKTEEVKPEVKREKDVEKHTEKPKDHLKHEVKRPEAPKQTEGHKQKKGFIGGLRKLFGDKNKRER